MLSNSINEPPENLCDKVEMYSGDIEELISQLEDKGYKHAYIDGGTIITAFINLQLINEITITKAPVILGKGIPLFGEVNKIIKLVNSDVISFPNDFVQVKYDVNYL